MEDFVYFFSFQDPNVAMVVAGITLLSISAAMVGTFTFLDKKALLGDAISHAVLPGVCLAFMFAGSKNPYWIVLGAFITGAVSTYAIEWISRSTKLKEDTVIAAVLSVFFGIGILLFTQLQQTGDAALSGLDHFLFGNAISIVYEDLMVYGILALLVIVCLLVFYKEFKLIIFNPGYAQSVGLPVKRLKLLFNTLLVMAVVTGIQAIGVVLMAALLITPPAAARFWSDRLKIILLLAVIFAVLSGIAGAYISFAVPHMPTGPWVVMAISFIAFASFFFAGKKGILSKWYNQRNYQQKIHRDHLLKSLYQVRERNAAPLGKADILELFPGKEKETKRFISKLKKEGQIEEKSNHLLLTPTGLVEAKRVVRLHRLWELYLAQYLNLAPDHVHDMAEKMEHLLTPELEAKLDASLDYPTQDPHHSKIPRDHDL
ncbi:metal ABC transporter permease [Litoribacter ruber]|uniref:metal ABC transporter permease n=1 Tax=Litoribacter ruber TaxID=702568 RepID=UPI001BDA55B6|nr:iron chelate uptake ABC transporter family permease subunit [Litoribacter ruber]MBT0810167.1 metal ABC transporter permease [Litoribacter ruber]